MIRYFTAVIWLIFIAMPAHAQDFPELTGRVVDQADLLSDAEEISLTAKLEALETASGRQLVVATVSDLQGYDIEDYGYQLGRKWALGDAERDDGALLLVAPNERRVTIEIGYGLEAIIPDVLANNVIQQAIIPRFKADDYPGGILAGADSLITQLTLPEEEARAYAGSLEQQVREESDNGNAALIIFWIVILLFFVLPFFFSGKGKRYRGSSGPIIIWGPGGGGGWGSGSSSGSSSWGGGGGGFGGGGFSGGGGSFGGGGASGGW